MNISRVLLTICLSCLLSSTGIAPSFADVPEQAAFAKAKLAAAKNAEALERSDRILKAVLREADPKTLLIPNFFMTDPPKKLARLNRTRYSPFNSAADLYCYLVIASYLLEPDLYAGRMLEMLKNEQLYTNAEKTVPGEYSLHQQKVGGPSLFGAGEYAKDGLISVTELVGSTPWHTRMEVMMVDLMDLAQTPSDFGMLPTKDSELNGDVLQVFPRLFWKSGDPKYLALNRRVSDAYFKEVLPGSAFLPVTRWNFVEHRGVSASHLRDHGNEAIVGLVMSTVMENLLKSDRAALYLEESRKMIDRVLESANPDGLLYNQIDVNTLKPIDSGIADSWGYIYGAVYNLFLLTGDEKYRLAIEKVLSALRKYKGYSWEGQHYDGYADSIEGAIYLMNRLPHAAAAEWVDSEMLHIWEQQQADGHADGTYLEGNFIRTSLLYGLMKSQGVFAKNWAPGLGIGAAQSDGSLMLSVTPPTGNENWKGIVRFDTPRHAEIFHLPKNFLRLNEFPEWFTVDREAHYQLRRAGSPEVKDVKGEQLAEGVELSAGEWVLQRAGEGKEKADAVSTH